MGRRVGARTVSVDQRVAAVALVRSGVRATRVSARMGVAPSTVRTWVVRYERAGMDGLRTRVSRGRPPRFSVTEVARLFQEVLGDVPLKSWRAPSLRRLAREVERQGRVGYDVDHLVRRLRPLLARRDRLLPGRGELKSPRTPRREAMSKPVPHPAREELDASIRAKDLAAVRSRLERDPALVGSKNRDGLSPVMVAVYGGASDIARELASRAPTDLFESACLGDVERLEKLLLADPGLLTAYSPDGWTALHLAAHFGQPAAAKLLLSRGAKVGAVAKNGIANQPLQAAIAGRHPELVRILIAAGADVNHHSHGGFTAAHLAAENGDLETLSLLKDARADLTARAEGGKTPLDLAREGGKAEAVRWLEKQVPPT